MKKQLLLIHVLLLSLSNAQNNTSLHNQFEKEKREDEKKLNSFIEKWKRYDESSNLFPAYHEQKEILAGFFPDGRPYFYRRSDLDQVKNSNADFLQTGTIQGLSTSFNGETIKYTIFDGGRAFAGHILFNNMPNRVNNMEAPTMNYSAHATGVTGFIGAKDLPHNFQLQNGGTHSVNFRGIAPNSTFDNYSFTTTVLPSNTSTSNVFQKILFAQPKISNHSYGTNPGWESVNAGGVTAYLWQSFYNAGTYYDLNGTYYTNDRSYDQIVYANPSYIIVKSAGNSYGDGPTDKPGNPPKFYLDSAGNPVQFLPTDVIPPNNCNLGYDCIGSGSLAKNIIVVGATDIITANNGRYVSANDVVHSAYSSAGPRDDGGIKPDISTTGTNVAHASTDENTVGSQSVAIGSGTSYSGPIVTGIIGLWMQINNQLFPSTELNAASAKSLMVHSASEAGNIGPDPLFGWGYINAKKGAELLVSKSNNSIIFKDEILNNAVVNKETVVASGSEPLKVTISWIDPAFTNIPTTYQNAHNNRNSILTNDLDLRIIDLVDNTTYFPWRLNANDPNLPATKADNTVDNIEQVVIESPVAGRSYRIEVSNKGSLVNDLGVSTVQNYSIIGTGFTTNTTNNLGIDEFKTNVEGIKIVPTLTKDFVNILNVPKKSQLNVYDLTGKLILKRKIDSNKTDLDLTIFPEGIYIVEVKTDKESFSKKVIKQ